MIERGCIKCGYILAGLPAAGTVVTCPECGHPTDLSVPPPARVSPFTPYHWSAGVMTLFLAYIALDRLMGTRSGSTATFFLVAGMLSGAITAGVMTYRMTGRGPEIGLAPRPRWARLLLSAGAAVVSVGINYVVTLVMLALVTYLL